MLLAMTLRPAEMYRSEQCFRGLARCREATLRCSDTSERFPEAAYGPDLCTRWLRQLRQVSTKEGEDAYRRPRQPLPSV